MTRLYYFSASNYYLKKGWQTIDNYDFFYCNSDGSVLTGRNTVDSTEYIFGDDGYVQGFKVVNGNRYYYYPNGTLAKGRKYLCGKYFIFDDTTGVFKKYANMSQIIDVSHHQGRIDWDEVKRDGSVNGVVVRMGYSTSGIDREFKNNITGLNRVGIPYTVYLTSYARSSYEAQKEADYLVNTIRLNNVYINPMFSIYYDLEGWDWIENGTNLSTNTNSKETYHGIMTTFIDTVKNKLGYKVKVYSGREYVYNKFYNSDRQYVGWIADWGTHGNDIGFYTWDNYCKYTGSYEMWQYTNAGRVRGINGNVDRSILWH